MVSLLKTAVEHKVTNIRPEIYRVLVKITKRLFACKHVPVEIDEFLS